jgi:hypothetical protein
MPKNNKAVTSKRISMAKNCCIKPDDPLSPDEQQIVFLNATAS